MVPVECRLGWSCQGNAVTAVAVVKLNEERQGVLTVSYHEKRMETSLHHSILALLTKVVSSIHHDRILIWSIPGYSTISHMMGQAFIHDIQKVFLPLREVKREEGNEDDPHIKNSLEWSKTQLMSEEGWITKEIKGATLEEVETAEKKRKSNPSIPKIQWATLFDVPESYVAFDLETTGKHPSFARIIEIGAVKVHKGQVSTFHTYVNPKMKLPKAIRTLTNISQKQVDQAPFPWQAIRNFYRFVGDSPILVGHNVQYDIMVLNYHASRFKVPQWEREAFCTKQQAQQFMIGLPDTKLVTVCEALGITNPAPHQALADAESSRVVFEKLFGREEPIQTPFPLI